MVIFMQKYITQNISVIFKICLVFCIGIVLGIMIYNFADYEYTEIIQNIFEQSKQENFDGINVLVNGMKNNVIYIILLHISLLCIFTPFVVFFLLVLKSISVGIYICTLFSVFGISKGLIVVFVGAILPNIVSLMGYILICTNILNIYNDSINGVKMEFSKWMQKLYLLVIAFSLLSFSLVIEQLASSVMLNMYNKI